MIENIVTSRVSRRGFIHKRVGRFVKRGIRAGLTIAGAAGVPGASIARSFLRGGSRSLPFNRSRAAQLARGRATARARRAAALTPKGPGGGLSLFPGVPGGLTGFAEPTVEGTCPKGHHLNKSSYFLKDGTSVAAMSRCVKNRRRNNSNGRAAMRAARRLLGRKKSQDAIDKALRAFAPRGRSRKQQSAPRGTGPIVVAS